METLPVFSFTSSLSCLCIAHQFRSFLFLGDQSGAIEIWNINSLKRLLIWNPHSKLLLGIHVFQKDFKALHILTHGRDNLMKEWVFDQAQSMVFVDSCNIALMNFCIFQAFSFDYNTQPIFLCLPKAFELSKIDIWNWNDKKQVCTTTTTNSSKDSSDFGSCMCLKWITSEKQEQKPRVFLLAGFENGILAVFHFDLSKIQCSLQHYIVSHCQPLLCIQYNFASNIGITGAIDNKLSCFQINYQNGALVGLQEISQLKLSHSGTQSLVLDWHANFILKGSWNGVLQAIEYLHQEKTWKVEREISYHGNSNVILVDELHDSPNPCSALSYLLSSSPKSSNSSSLAHVFLSVSSNGVCCLWNKAFLTTYAV